MIILTLGAQNSLVPDPRFGSSDDKLSCFRGSWLLEELKLLDYLHRRHESQEDRGGGVDGEPFR